MRLMCCCKPQLHSKVEMPSIPRTSRRRKMMVLASARRRIQKLGPYQSMALLLVPVTLVEPLKFVALFVAGEGHWLTGTGMILGAYAVSILLVERLFRVVKPKLMTLSWFANCGRGWLLSATKSSRGQAFP